MLPFPFASLWSRKGLRVRSSSLWGIPGRTVTSGAVLVLGCVLGGGGRVEVGKRELRGPPA